MSTARAVPVTRDEDLAIRAGVPDPRLEREHNE